MNRFLTKYRVTVLGFAAVLVAGPMLLGGQSVFAADSCSAPATNYGTDTMSATVPGSGSYTIWTHIEVPSSSANSVLLNVSGTCYNVGGSASIPANTWEWINYYDGKSANVVQQSLSQGVQSVELIGTSSDVRVDEVEFVPGTCTPTGNGSNCVTATNTGGGSGTAGTGGTTTNNPASSRTPVIIQSGGTITPTDTSVPTQIAAPVTLEPATPNSSSDPIKETQYYLNKKLLATITTAPFSYHLDTKKILNGTYTLTTKTVYESGSTTTTSQKLIIKNPASFTQFMLVAEHYIVPEAVILLVLIVGIVLFRKWLSNRQQSATGLAVDGGSPTNGTNYTPLSYAPTPYPTDNSQPTNSGGSYGPLPYGNMPPSQGASPMPQLHQLPPSDGTPPSGDNWQPPR